MISECNTYVGRIIRARRCEIAVCISARGVNNVIEYSFRQWLGEQCKALLAMHIAPGVWCQDALGTVGCRDLQHTALLTMSCAETMF